MLGFAEMLMLSLVSYASMSLVLVLIENFGPTNNELVECTSLVTSILFSYYFMSSGSEFVFVHFIALAAFIGAFTLNVYGLSKQQQIIEMDKRRQSLLQIEKLRNKLTQQSGHSIQMTKINKTSKSAKNTHTHSHGHSHSHNQNIKENASTTSNLSNLGNISHGIKDSTMRSRPIDDA